MSWFTRKEDNEPQVEQSPSAEEILQDQMDISRRSEETMRKLEIEASQCPRRCYCECG